jgi:hypothetical protein
MLKKSGKYVLLPLAMLYLVLLIPDTDQATPQVAEAKPFAWNRDERWKSLENAFSALNNLPQQQKDSLYQVRMRMLDERASQFMQDSLIQHGDPRLTHILDAFFETAPVVAATRQTNAYIAVYNRFRKFMKEQSRNWNPNHSTYRNDVYTLMYGMRAAVEEVLLQADTLNFNPVQTVKDEPSATPSTLLQGIRVHSGDLLVSRGGAEVSAFISRGNDYPGNFSHVALLHVDEKGEARFIEAHIEKGVAIATAEEYLKDRKLRFMVLRPRADLPQVKANPMLPHQAACFAMKESENRHIPYDFKMDFHDSSAMFCSEVGSFAYKKFGIQLWQAESTISSIGTAGWLNTFGVENFVTQMPSDLEYDPQLAIVAEWCNPETLFKDHLDNAVMDALLERANKGEKISYSTWLLPVARVIKGYSIIQNTFGKPGIIPEGMSATRALKNNSFVERYQQVQSYTEEKVNDFIQANGYRPPYWQLVAFAQSSL